ncbi:MAG TPA: FKBP-type peptidyl-prolyl cis-trans isomerase [Acidimicrobiales bacterium]|nr:FKBP-type peptidyl-prolyl cis-trans isomerase [Acidimicrobiales bacterium]
MGTVKRERQRQGKQARSVAEQSAARRQKTKRTGIRLGIVLVVVLAAAFVYSLLSRDDGSDNTETADTTTTSSPFTNPDLAAEVLDREPPAPANAPADIAPDAVKVTTLIEGEGEGAAAGDTVVVHYVGVLSDGTKFDDSWSKQQPFPVENLGQASVIPGWNEGLIGAKIGERRRLEIGPDKAYGAAGQPPAIPANAPLAFEIDVIDIKKPGG